MSATALDARIALFEALCEEIREKSKRGVLQVGDIQALRNDLVAVGTANTLRPHVRGQINLAMARADGVEQHLILNGPTLVTQSLLAAVKVLCETLGWLKAELETLKAPISPIGLVCMPPIARQRGSGERGVAATSSGWRLTYRRTNERPAIPSLG